MKKLFAVLCVSMIPLLFCSCKEQPAVSKYYISDTGSLIAKYEDGSVKDLGSLQDSVANGVYDIHVSQDGYYVINNIVTDIRAKQPLSYTIDENGNLVVIYTDTTTENLGKFGDDAINTVETILVSDDGYYVINGIKTNLVAIASYSVSFRTGYSINIPSQQIKDGYKVERPILERKGYTLRGWFCNKEEWRFNSDVVKNDMTLDAVWQANTYEVAFDTGCEQILDAVNITYDQDFTLPQLERDGYTFRGWLYHNTPIKSNKWSIDQNCTLTASWTANQYSITLDPCGGSVTNNTFQVVYGDSYTLSVPTNNYGAFVGWFYNDTQITDAQGHSLSPWSFATNITATTSWTIKLSTAEDLQQLHAYPNGHFELSNPIDMSTVLWTPVGTQDNPFTGKIDGSNYAINGLTITGLLPDCSLYGLIGYAKDASFHNVKLTNINIKLSGIDRSIYVGGLIAHNVNCTIQSASVSGSIEIANHSSSYDSYAGGIVSFTETPLFSNCINHANVTAKTVAGGITAYAGAPDSDTSFINCVNTGSMSSTKAGGIVGDCIDLTADSCKNSGTITGSNIAGGIAGRVYYAARLNACSNAGAITVTSTTAGPFEGAGGIIGTIEIHPELLIDYSNITNCYNIGSIDSSKNAGGIIGAGNLSLGVAALTVSKCYNAGSIVYNYASFCGGIGGALSSFEILECANFGALSGDGIVATISHTTLQNSTITDCYYNYDTTKTSTIQGSKTTERYASSLYVDRMFWSTEIWDFHDDNYPTLKMETTLPI